MGPPPLLIVNPVAGGGRTGRLWPFLRDALGRLGFRFDHVETRGPGEATAAAADAARRGVALVVAVGGDGTVNEVVNGITDDDGRPRATLGALITGRGRDAARTLGLPGDPLAAAGRLARGADASRDLGVALWPGGRRFFVNAAGAGFDAAVAARAASLGGSGTLPYLRALAGSLGAYAPVHASIACDGRERASGPVAAVVVANGPCFGGGMKVAPGADAADGLLDVVVLGNLGRWELLRWLPTIYWGGHLRNPKVALTRATHVRVESRVRLPVQLDGEPCGHTPLLVRVCPAGLRVRI